MIEDESVQKNCFVLKVLGKQFTCKPIPLKTVRPLLYKQIELYTSGIDPRRPQLIETFIKTQIEKMIEDAEKLNDLKPFVRLKIEYGIGLDGVVPEPG